MLTISPSFLGSHVVQAIGFPVLKKGFNQVMLAISLAEYVMQMEQVMLPILKSYIVEMTQNP